MQITSIQQKWRTAWIEEYRKLYINTLKKNVKNTIGESDNMTLSVDLFTKKQQMINSFELQVLDPTDSKRVLATYKLKTDISQD